MDNWLSAASVAEFRFLPIKKWLNPVNIELYGILCFLQPMAEAGRLALEIVNGSVFQHTSAFTIQVKADK